MTAHLINSSLSEQSDTVFMYGCHKIVHSFACYHLQRVEHSRAGAPKPRQPSYGGGYSDRNAYSYSDRDRGRSGRDRRCVPHTYPLSTSHNAPAIMMLPYCTVAVMLAVNMTAMCLKLTPLLPVCWLGGCLPIAPQYFSMYQR